MSRPHIGTVEPGGSRDASRPRHDGRLAPAALAGWASSALAVVLGMRWQSAGAGAAVAAAVACAVPALWAWRSTTMRTLAVLAVMVGCLVAILTAVRVHGVVTGPVAEAARRGAFLSVDVVLTGDPQVRHGRVVAGRQRPDVLVVPARTVLVESRGVRTAVRVPVRLQFRSWEPWATTLLPGSRLSIEAVAAPPRVGDRAAALLDVRHAEVTAGTGFVQRAAGRVRAGLRQAVHGRPDDAAALLPGLAIGDTSMARADLVDDMRSSGLSHLTVVSGANVTIVLACVMAALGLLRLHGAVAVAVAAITLVMFVVVARPDPSVLRAAVMGAVALLAIADGRARTLRGGSRRSLGALSIAVLALVAWDPWLATSWGFALSVAATAGLVLGARPVAGLLASRLPAWTRPVSEVIAVAVVAQVAVAPVLLVMGATLTPWAVPANVLAAPAVPAATVSGLVAAVVAPASPPIARIVATPGTWATGWIAAVARRTASIQHAAAGSQWWPGSWSGAWIDWLSPRWPPVDWDAAMCDVGQGTALVVRTDLHTALLFDVGPDPDRVDHCLDVLHITALDAIVLTHFHADHVDGLAGAVRSRPVGMVVTSPLLSPRTRVEVVAALDAGRGIPERVAAAGERLRWGDVEMRVVWPAAWLDTESPENDHSVVTLVSVGDMTMLVTGDVELAGQSAVLDIMRTQGIGRGVDVMTMPHHGSRRQVREFAQWVHPRVVLVPVGRDNDYGHPADEALALYRREGSVIARTDTDGLLVVREGPGGAEVLGRR